MNAPGSYPTHPGRLRRSERLGLHANVQYRRSTVRMAGVTLDLSCHGVRLAAIERMRVGEVLWITLPGLPPRRAAVKWVDKFDVGCEFDVALHPAVFDRIAAGEMD
ncbi:PilZ domain-containing protein [Novosphingobium sp.]|uniref:PilZ domain-containing protein n=1 Tax=Novosphingobium sp. TaxID=1874826 RepID=UPI003B522401